MAVSACEPAATTCLEEATTCLVAATTCLVTANTCLKTTATCLVAGTTCLVTATTCLKTTATCLKAATTCLANVIKHVKTFIAHVVEAASHAACISARLAEGTATVNNGKQAVGSGRIALSNPTAWTNQRTAAWMAENHVQAGFKVVTSPSTTLEMDIWSVEAPFSCSQLYLPKLFQAIQPLPAINLSTAPTAKQHSPSPPKRNGKTADFVNPRQVLKNYLSPILNLANISLHCNH